MGKSFDLTARLKVSGPYNVKPIVSALKRELKSVKGSIDIKISPSAARNAVQLNKALDVLQSNISKVSSNAINATYSIDQLGRSFSQFGQNAKANNTALNATVKNMNKVKSSAASATSEIESFGKSAGLAVKRFAAFTVATGAIFGFVAAVAKASSEAISFQNELVKISQVTGSTIKSVQSLGDEVSNLSVKYGISSKELLNAAKTLAQAGFSARETKKALDSLAKSTLAPSFDDLGNTTEGLISIFGQFRSELYGTKIAVEDFDSILGSINQVSKDFAVEADDIVTAIRGAGSVFAQASEGLDKPKESLNKLIALFTSVRATTRESAESISTGLRTIFARIQRRSTIDFLKQFGVQLEDLEGKFVGPFDAVKRLNEGLKDIDPKDIRYSQIAEELGGIRQLSKLLPLIRQFPVALEAFDAAQRGTNSTTEDAVKAQESLIVKFRKVREEFLRLVKDVLHTDSFSSLAKTALDFASTLIKIASAVKSVAPYLALALGIGAVKGGAQFLTGFKQAFTGGGKGLAGGAGAAAGTVLSGGAGSKNAQSLDSNTAALKALTIALIGSRGAAGLTYPKGLTFAKGGIVPGTGNRDTVPAMLTPGEMVIPKRFVEGGEVQAAYPGRTILPKVMKQILAAGDSGWKVTAKQLLGESGASKAIRVAQGSDLIAGTGNINSPAVGALFLKPEGNDTTTLRYKKIASLVQEDKKIAASAGGGEGNRVLFPFHAGFIESSKAKAFEDTSTSLIKKSVQSLAGQFGGGGIINTKDIDKIIQTSNLEGAGGSLFEGFVQSLASKFDKGGGSGARWDTSPDAFGQGLENLFGPIPAGLKRLDVKLAANSGSYVGGSSSLAEKTLSDIRERKLSYYKGSDAGHTNSISKGSAQYLASGGAVGTDTVPAMLTPGEFVINRDSAQSIGYGNLDKINKYASGGQVKENPLFNNKSFSSLSSNPTLAGKSGIQKLNFLDKFQRSLDSLSPTAQQLQNALKRYIQLINKGVTSEEALTRVQTALTKVQAKQAQTYATQTSSGTAASGRTIRSRGFGKTSLYDSLSRRFSGKPLSEEQQERKANRQARFGQAVYFGSAAVGSAGAYLQSTAKTGGEAGAGGALLGAAGGAAAGAQFGPLGAGLGALVGGVAGARQAFYDFESSKALKNSEKALDGFAKSIESVSNIITSSDILKISQGGSDVLNRQRDAAAIESDKNATGIAGVLASFTGKNQATASRAANELGIRYYGTDAKGVSEAATVNARKEIEQIFAEKQAAAVPLKEKILGLTNSGQGDAARELASRNRELLRFTDESYKAEALSKASSLSSVDSVGLQDILRTGVGFKTSGNFDDTNSKDKIQKDITNAQNIVNINKALSGAVTEVELVIITLNKFNAELDRGTNLFDKFSQANDTLISQIQGNFAITKTNRENPFANIDSFSAGEVRSASRGLGSESLATGVNAAKSLKDKLPEFLGKLTAGGEENIRAEFSSFLGFNGVDLPTEVRNLLEESFKSESSKRSTGEAKFDDIKKPEFANKLLKDSGLDSYVDSAKKVFDKRIELEHRYVDEISKTIQLREIIEQRATDIDKVQADITKRKADREGRDLSFGEATAGVSAKFSRLTTTSGFLGRPTTRNPNAATLGAEITAAQAAQQGITNRGNARGGLSPAEIAEQARLGKLIKDNSEALTILKDSTDILAAIESERSKIEKKKEAGRGLADKVFGGGLKGRLELNRQVGAAQSFLAGDDRGLSSQKGYEDIKGGMETLIQIAKFQGDEAGAKEIQAKSDERFGIAKPGEEDALAKAEEEVGRIQLEAANALKTVAEVSLPTMIGNANNAFLQLQNFLTVAIAKFEGGVAKRAGGGYISGSGGPRSDSIPAMLSNGEYVINAAAVNRIGVGQLDNMNRTGYADGGSVFSSTPTSVRRKLGKMLTNPLGETIVGLTPQSASDGPGLDEGPRKSEFEFYKKRAIAGILKTIGPSLNTPPAAPHNDAVDGLNLRSPSALIKNALNRKLKPKEKLAGLTVASPLVGLGGWIGGRYASEDKERTSQPIEPAQPISKETKAWLERNSDASREADRVRWTKQLNDLDAQKKARSSVKSPPIPATPIDYRSSARSTLGGPTPALGGPKLSPRDSVEAESRLRRNKAYKEALERSYPKASTIADSIAKGETVAAIPKPIINNGPRRNLYDGSTAASRAYADGVQARRVGGNGRHRNADYEKNQEAKRERYKANKAAGRPGRRGFASGGYVGGGGGNVASGISSAMGQFQSSVLILSQAVNQLANINIPSNITMTGNHTVEVIINGATVLNDLLNGPLTGLIKSEIQSAIQRHIPLQQRMEGTY